MSSEINDYVLNRQEDFPFVFERFFKEPDSTEEFDQYGDKIKSSLYILRKDISHCLEQQDNEQIAIWGGTSLILIGIDLLSQYYSGKIPKIDPNVQTSSIFSKFCIDFNISNISLVNNISPLYYLRNSFVHGYSLRAQSSRGNIKYYFSVIYNDENYLDVVNDLGVQDITHYYNINLYSLSTSFTNSLNLYKQELLIDDDLKTKFLKVHKHYKFIVPIDVISERLTNSITLPTLSYLHDVNFAPYVTSSGSSLYAST